MLTIEEARGQLEEFQGIDNLINKLYTLELSGNIENKGVLADELRRLLREITENEANNNITQNGVSLSDAAYNALLALAEFSPINEKCPITMENIPEEDKIYVLTGHQFNIHALATWIKQVEEFKNPLTNLNFPPRDQITIQQMCTKKNITLLKQERPQVNRNIFFNGAESSAGQVSAQELAQVFDAIPGNVTSLSLDLGGNNLGQLFEISTQELAQSFDAIPGNVTSLSLDLGGNNLGQRGGDQNGQQYNQEEESSTINPNQGQ